MRKFFDQGKKICVNRLNPIDDAPFWGCSRIGGSQKDPLSLPKICHTYPTMLKLGTVIPYLKKIQKLCKSRDTRLKFN